MIATEQTLENLTFTINQEIHVQAPLDVTFAALLERLGPGNGMACGSREPRHHIRQRLLLRREPLIMHL
jgi:hypothetical protein